MICENLSDKQVLELLLDQRQQAMSSKKDMTESNNKLELIDNVINLFYTTIFLSHNLFNTTNDKIFLQFFLGKMIEVNFGDNNVKINSIRKQDKLFELFQQHVQSELVPLLYKGAFSKIFKYYAQPCLAEPQNTNVEELKTISDVWIGENVKFIYQLSHTIIESTHNIDDLVKLKNKLRESIFSDNTKFLEQEFIAILQYCHNMSTDFENERAMKKIWKEVSSNLFHNNVVAGCFEPVLVRPTLERCQH